MAACELLATCGFFGKYRETLDLACRGFIKAYCRGPMQEECERKRYRRERGFPPEDDMLPTGLMLPREFRE